MHRVLEEYIARQKILDEHDQESFSKFALNNDLGEHQTDINNYVARWGRDLDDTVETLEEIYYWALNTFDEPVQPEWVRQVHWVITQVRGTEPNPGVYTNDRE